MSRMDVPHALYNHSGHPAYTLPPGIPMPVSVATAGGGRRPEGEVAATIIQQQQQQQQQHQIHNIAQPPQQEVIIPAEQMPHGFSRENVPAGMVVRMPWMEQHLAGKLPVSSAPPAPSVQTEERNDKQHTAGIQGNDNKPVWSDVKPPTAVRKKREQKAESPESPDDIDNDEVVSNFIPLTWSKNLKPVVAPKMEKGNSSREDSSETAEQEEEAALVQQSFVVQPVGYTCVQCGHVVHHSQLAKHIRMHTADRPFKCEVCKRAFRQKSNLIVHMRMHTGELPFPCEICGKAFRQKSILVTHVRTHTREMPYKCTMCPKAFTQKSNLVEHVRVHTGEKPYICPECNKAFAQKSNLVVHIRSHTGEAPFKCGVCNKAFRQKSILTTHMRTHTGEVPFKCETCDRGFAQKSNLVEHSRQHTGEKPYVCQECDRAFIRHQDLLQHQRHHTGRKPYDCPTCGKMFVRKKHMEKHYQTHIKHRFNCRVCGLGFMDENLMVIHLTTHSHCHICDIKFDTREELTEHCRRHAMGMPEGTEGVEAAAREAAATMSVKLPQAQNSAPDQSVHPHPHDRMNNDGQGPNKSFKTIPPDAYRVSTIPSTQQLGEGSSRATEYVPVSST